MEFVPFASLIMDKWTPYAKEYDPLICGSIDGTVTQIHDKAITRAISAKYIPDKRIKTALNRTLFVARLNTQTNEQTLRQIFSTFGTVADVTLIRDVVTGISRGYAFIEFSSSKSLQEAYRDAHKLVIDGHSILADYEHGHNMKGWKPRRLGGGFAGKKESGQLRFGCRDKPFKKPISAHLTNKVPQYHHGKGDYKTQRLYGRNHGYGSGSYDRKKL